MTRNRKLSQPTSVNHVFLFNTYFTTYSIITHCYTVSIYYGSITKQKKDRKQISTKNRRNIKNQAGKHNISTTSSTSNPLYKNTVSVQYQTSGSTQSLKLHNIPTVQ